MDWMLNYENENLELQSLWSSMPSFGVGLANPTEHARETVKGIYQHERIIVMFSLDTG